MLRAVLTAAFLAVAACAQAPQPAAAAVYQTEARAGIIYDMSTDQTLFEKNADEPLPPASMSKLMTLYMLFDALRDGRVALDTEFGVSTKARQMGGSTMFLDETDRPTVEELIKGIIVQSGNDACVVVAEGLAGSEEAFARQMNAMAPEIGLTNSTFANSSGWPHPDHRMTMRDLAMLSVHLIEEFPQYYDYFDIEEFDFDGRSPANRFNRNPVLGLGLGADGLKTGHTEEAGYGLTGSAIQEGRRIVFVFTGLNSNAERRQEAEAMINWGFRQFNKRDVAAAGDVIATAPVWMGAAEQVNLVAADDITLLVPAIGGEELTTRLVYNSPIEAPLAKGQQVAEIIVSVPDMPDRRIALVAENDVPRGGFVPRMRASGTVLLGMAMGQVRSYLE